MGIPGDERLSERTPKTTNGCIFKRWDGSTQVILGVLHEDGYLELRDRSKDIIISGGENISTIEIEAVLFKHPAVLGCCCGCASPDDKWGETPCAFVTFSGRE